MVNVAASLQNARHSIDMRTAEQGVKNKGVCLVQNVAKAIKMVVPLLYSEAAN